MTKEEHLDYMGSLERDYPPGSFSLALPKAEGAFWFGDLISPSQYAGKYREECVKRGWVDA